MRIIKTYLTRISHTRMNFMKYFYSPIFTCILITNSRRLIGTSIINQDDFNIMERLRKKSI